MTSDFVFQTLHLSSQVSFFASYCDNVLLSNYNSPLGSQTYSDIFSHLSSLFRRSLSTYYIFILTSSHIKVTHIEISYNIPHHKWRQSFLALVKYECHTRYLNTLFHVASFTSARCQNCFRIKNRKTIERKVIQIFSSDISKRW